MRKLTFLLVLAVLGVILAGCGSPPPLVSEKYLADTSIISQDPCGPPCFAGITVGETTFADALSKIKANTTAFKDVQSQDDPPQAAWSDAVNGEACCQMTADKNTGLVDAILLRLAPKITIKDVIAKYGEPEYVSVLGQDYSADETAVGLIYPKIGNVLWVMPGNGSSTLDENDPVVIALYFAPNTIQDLLSTATLMKWTGYESVSFYRTATPIVTPIPTTTPTPAP